MSDPRVSAYADAALAIANAEGDASEVTDELFRFGQILLGNDELRRTLSDPHLPVDKRAQIAEDVLQGRATATTVSFVSLLVASGRIGDLPAIAEEMTQRAASAAGETVAEVRSAVPLSDTQVAELARALSARTNRTVTVRNVVDESVIGGVVTRIGDSVLDGSVRTRLNQLREAF
ncbi:MAG: ATP synthase F1 subunit delta [Microthrixaceae bacterium]|jgi:F-type H+-transporting ATPase subunit delta